MEEVNGTSVSEVAMKVVISLTLVGLCSTAMYLYYILWKRPQRIREKLRRQGIRGPKRSFFYGNIKEMERIVAEETKEASANSGHVAHNYAATLFPYFERWRKQYGMMLGYVFFMLKPIRSIGTPFVFLCCFALITCSKST